MPIKSNKHKSKIEAEYNNNIVRQLHMANKKG